jgi:hypothetical protein
MRRFADESNRSLHHKKIDSASAANLSAKRLLWFENVPAYLTRVIKPCSAFCTPIMLVTEAM